jgi:hypothetical protein
MKGTLEMERLSLRVLCEGNLEGDYFTENPKDMLSKAVEMTTFSLGASLLGNIERYSIPRAFDRRENFLYLGR